MAASSSSSIPELGDFDKIMQLAMSEASSMSDSPSTPLPTSQETSEKVKAALGSVNIKRMVDSIVTESPDGLKKIAASQLANANPEVMEQARKLAMGGQGDQIMKEMRKRGMDPVALRAQIKHEKKLNRANTPKSNIPTQSVIHINASRKAKCVNMNKITMASDIAKLLHTDTPVELSCSRLARGPLAEKIVKIWYNPDTSGKNRRTSKIIGFDIGSDLIVVVLEENLTLVDFEKAEGFLVQ